jgi:hypothetical protein
MHSLDGFEVRAVLESGGNQDDRTGRQPHHREQENPPQEAEQAQRHPLKDRVHFWPLYVADGVGFTGSNTTSKNVASGPRNSETSHQFKPLLPLPWAKPALMSESVNQPTAYWLVAWKSVMGIIGFPTKKAP